VERLIVLKSILFENGAKKNPTRNYRCKDRHYINPIYVL